MNVYIWSQIVFKVSKDHWRSYKQLKEEMSFFSIFKELFEVFRSLANNISLSEIKRQEIAQLKFPLAASFEMRGMRIVAIAQPLGQNKVSVALRNEHIHSILVSLRFLRPTQVLNTLPFHELPVFSSIHRYIYALHLKVSNLCNY